MDEKEKEYWESYIEAWKEGEYDIPHEWNEKSKSICIRDDLTDFLRAWHRVLSLYVRSPAYRKFVKEALTIPKTFFEYLGYGIYVGRKLPRYCYGLGNKPVYDLANSG